MESLKAKAAALGIGLDESMEGRFRRYMELLLDWNQKINLTAITEPEEIISKHFLDSLTVLLTGRFSRGVSLIDIGAGAGFPSIPVKIARPDLCVTMLDSLGKRVDFLGRVIADLGLDGARALHSRAEDAARTELRESFDVATARAVAALPVLAEYALPFVRVGGVFVAMKGAASDEEINAAKPAIRTLGGRIAQVKELPFDGMSRSLVVIEKLAPTPAKYPRKAGKPSKDPIK